MILCLVACLQTIVAGIEATEVVPGRTEYIDLQQNFQVLVDSANTPAALSRLLDDVKMCGARKITLVFGCEGLEEVAKRPYMGEVAHYKVTPLPWHPKLTGPERFAKSTRLYSVQSLISAN